jgi:hypothetical protein
MNVRNSKFKIMTIDEAKKHVEDVTQSVGAIMNIMTAATGGTKNMTIDQAVEWLLNDPKQWNNGKMPPSQVTELRRRYKRGSMKTNAKLNLIRRSEIFEEFIRFEFKK